MRDCVKNWLGPVFKQFDGAKLGEISPRLSLIVDGGSIGGRVRSVYVGDDRVDGIMYI
jgi:hypothetical protein